MKEKFFERNLKNLGILILLVGSFISVMKGIDRLDVCVAAEGVMISIFVAFMLIGSGYNLGALRAKKGENKPGEEYPQAFFEEVFVKKRKKKLKSWLVAMVTAVVFGIYIFVMVITAPFTIDKLINEGRYEAAFDAVIKSKLSDTKRTEYVEKLSPLMQEAYDEEAEKGVVLTVDGRKIIADGDRLYIDSIAEENLIYTAGSSDITAKGRFDNDFIYSGNHVLCIEILDGDAGAYKNVIAINIRTKSHQMVDYMTECYYMDKLTNGRILLSDDPVLVYDPFTSKIHKKQLSEKEREYIYSTMG